MGSGGPRCPRGRVRSPVALAPTAGVRPRRRQRLRHDGRPRRDTGRLTTAAQERHGGAWGPGPHQGGAGPVRHGRIRLCDDLHTLLVPAVQRAVHELLAPGCQWGRDQPTFGKERTGSGLQQPTPLMVRQPPRSRTAGPASRPPPTLPSRPGDEGACPPCRRLPARGTGSQGVLDPRRIPRRLPPVRGLRTRIAWRRARVCAARFPAIETVAHPTPTATPQLAGRPQYRQNIRIGGLVLFGILWRPADVPTFRICPGRPVLWGG
ncbi:hypothetical protein SUDANB140_04434 [Streptomyces sp. enrichment culture]